MTIKPGSSDDPIVSHGDWLDSKTDQTWFWSKIFEIIDSLEFYEFL